MTAGPGWFDDPTGRFELRYWDGEAWTDHVSSGGALSRASIDADRESYGAPARPMRASASHSTRTTHLGRWLAVAAVLFIAIPVIAVVVALGVSRESHDDEVLQPFDTPDGACEAWWQANVSAARDGWDDTRFARELRLLADATEPIDPTLASLLRSVAPDADAEVIRSSIETAYQRCVGVHRWRGATDDERATVGRRPR
jgi:hypothetical protein